MLQSSRRREEARRPHGQLPEVFRGVGTTVSWGVRVVWEDEEGRGKGRAETPSDSRKLLASGL